MWSVGVGVQGTYAFCAGEDGVVYCFNLQRGGELESFVKVGGQGSRSHRRPAHEQGGRAARELSEGGGGDGVFLD